MPKNIGFDSKIKSVVWSEVRTKVIISLLELGLILHPVLGLQMGLRLLKINPNDSPYPKNGPS